MTKAKHPGGRPTLYRREMCNRLVEAMGKGLTAEAAAARIGISARSLFYWQQQHPEFLQAIQEGRQRSQLWWEERALAMASGEAGNTQIVMLGLRNRSRAATGWNNDTVKLEHTGPEGGPVEVKAEHKIDIESLSHEQRDQLPPVSGGVRQQTRERAQPFHPLVRIHGQLRKAGHVPQRLFLGRLGLRRFQEFRLQRVQLPKTFVSSY